MAESGSMFLAGKCNAPRGECDVPRGECNAPRGECDVPRGECDVPRGECNAPRGECDVPRGECDTPRDECVVLGAPVALLLLIMNETQPMSLRDTAIGIAVRAGVLTVGGVVVGAWLFSVAAKAASGLVKTFAALFLLAVGAGVATWEVKKVQRRLAL